MVIVKMVNVNTILITVKMVAVTVDVIPYQLKILLQKMRKVSYLLCIILVKANITNNFVPIIIKFNLMSTVRFGSKYIFMEYEIRGKGVLRL
jgi:hypothetical protein